MTLPTPTTPEAVAEYLDTEPSENGAAYAFGRTAVALGDTGPDRVATRRLWMAGRLLHLDRHDGEARGCARIGSAA
ncbi:hypothetical protein KSP35_13195 [Aquihabitans sp. G128]|uniref:hypothetical protein n=1 Tax=Aquihabitans sp. G128 TaxID=2849779 RepID=UPI001C24D484|nr:hypothetical protein [Aquihabitans sp. G128]QXC59359.1 hypothetical protein KSP35_13195 [Aquihabitans sp. G128]